MTGARPTRTLAFLAAALLLGGLRDPRAFAAGAALLSGLLWAERPALGPAVPWLPWLGWAALSAALSASPLSSLPVLARWPAALGAASLAAAWDGRGRESWLRGLLGVGAVLAVAALWTGARAGLRFRNEMTGLIPPYYNYTAFVLAATAAAAAAWGLHPRGPRGRARAAAWAVAGLGVLCVLLARSRGAALGLAAAAAVWSMRRWGLRAAAVAAATAAVAGAFAAGSSGLLTKGRPRGEARPGIWRAAVAVASESPWFGEGPGQFGAGFRRHPVPSPAAAALWGLSTDYAHSEVLQTAAETGWGGLALWLGGLAAAVTFLRGRADPEPAREAAAAAVAAMGAQLLVDDMLQIPGLAFLFLTAAAVAGSRARSGVRWPRWAAVLVAVLGLGAWVPRALAEARPDRGVILFPTDAGLIEDEAYRSVRAGRWARAVELWARAESLAPYDAVYPWRLAEAYSQIGEWTPASAAARRALDREPGFLRARLVLVQFEFLQRDFAKASADIAEIRRRLASGPSGPAESGYERVVSQLDTEELADLDKMESYIRSR